VAYPGAGPGEAEVAVGPDHGDDAPAALLATPPEPTATQSGQGAGDTPLLALSDRWRVAHDGRLQWIVEHAGGSGGAVAASTSSATRS
jgi:hypothetical protein